MVRLFYNEKLPSAIGEYPMALRLGDNRSMTHYKQILTYKYRLRPTKGQARRLDFMLWQARKVYNFALEKRIEAYQERGETLGKYTLEKMVGEWRRNEPETIGQLPYDTAAASVFRLDKAFQAFFRRLKAGEKPGFPKFKGRDFFTSLEYRYGRGIKLIPEGNDVARLRIMNVGVVRVIFHRPLPDDCKIKHVVVKRKGVHWYACLMIERQAEAHIQHAPPVGIDVGIKTRLALSDGTMIDSPKWLRDSEAELRRLHRKLSRAKRGSNNRAAVKKRVAKLHEHVANQRNHWWQEVTTWLVEHYGLIAIEDLTLKFMTQNKHLSKSAHDAGLGNLALMLDYKAKARGVSVIMVNPAYTTQRCSQCGYTEAKALSERVHRCVSCGLELDRDVNAARNILQCALTASTEAVGA